MTPAGLTGSVWIETESIHDGRTVSIDGEHFSPRRRPSNEMHRSTAECVRQNCGSSGIRPAPLGSSGHPDTNRVTVQPGDLAPGRPRHHPHRNVASFGSLLDGMGHRP